MIWMELHSFKEGNLRLWNHKCTCWSVHKHIDSNEPELLFSIIGHQCWSQFQHYQKPLLIMNVTETTNGMFPFDRFPLLGGIAHHGSTWRHPWTTLRWSVHFHQSIIRFETILSYTYTYCDIYLRTWYKVDCKYEVQRVWRETFSSQKWRSVFPCHISQLEKINLLQADSNIFHKNQWNKISIWNYDWIQLVYSRMIQTRSLI